MTTAWALLPDFLLIAVGFGLCRFTPLGRAVWDGVERLVYYLLFPVLLFNSIVRTPLQIAATIELALAGWAVIASGIVLAYALRLSRRVDARLHASGAQTAFRFNSFIGFALAERFGGPQGRCQRLDRQRHRSGTGNFNPVFLQFSDHAQPLPCDP